MRTRAGIGFGAGAAVSIAGEPYEDLEAADLVGALGGIGAAIGEGIGALVGALYVKPTSACVRSEMTPRRY